MGKSHIATPKLSSGGKASCAEVGIHSLFVLHARPDDAAMGLEYGDRILACSM